MRNYAAAGYRRIFFGEVPGLNRRGWVGTMLRNFARRPAVRWPAAIAAVGSRAVTEYRKLASASCAVENIPYCCNIEPFHQAEREPTPCGAVRFLYCGQLIRRKGVDLLLHAFIDVAQSNSLATLTLVGDGPLRPRTAPSDSNDLAAARIRFAGFQPVEELPPWFSQADVFVLPSRHDGWGVVVNQALAAGLAIVSSDAVGAAADLVQPGVNGCVFPAGDAKNLREARSSLAADPARVAEMGCRSRELANSCSPRQSVDRWFELCSRVVPSIRSTRVAT